MRGFNVLDPLLHFPKRLFLEASAGTGKTFAIEHLFIRLLCSLEEEIEFSQILIVTFTKAATEDLKQRIYFQLESTLRAINEGQIPSHLEKNLVSQQSIFLAKQKIKRALSIFDECAIYTIHGFCFHLLQEFEPASFFLQEKESQSKEALLEISKDFFRIFPLETLLHPLQLEILLKKNGYDLKEIQKKIVAFLDKSSTLQSSESLSQGWSYLEETLSKLNHLFSLSQAKLFSDLIAIAPCFKETCNRQKELKSSIIYQMQKGSTSLCEGKLSSCLSLLSPIKRLKKAWPAHLNYPLYWEKFFTEIIPSFVNLSDPLKIELSLALEAQKYIRNVLKAENRSTFNELIEKVCLKKNDLLFAQEVRKKYRAVFIDEFQDTDRIQWEIFSSLFFKTDFKGYFTVVGDPKQSIYRFRNADLYTYFEAKNTFPCESLFALDTNYRSHPSLVEGMNMLFEKQPLFQLPKLNTSIPYLPIKAGVKEEFEWKDGKKSLHLLKGASQKELLEFFCGEIWQLKKNHDVSLESIAILVKDRFQAAEAIATLRKNHIDAVFLGASNRNALKAVKIFCEWVEAAIDPTDRSKLKRCLGGPLFSFTSAELLSVDPKYLALFVSLKITFENQGIFAAFIQLMETDPIKKQLIETEEGSELYQELLSLAILCVEKKIEPAICCDKLHALLEVEEDLSIFPFSKKEKVQILTIHASKGLEFDFVFPLGILFSSKKKETIVFDNEKQQWSSSQEVLQDHIKELDAEKMRLLYVALTRAKKRLYLPYLEEGKNMEGAPVDHFLKNLSFERLSEKIYSFSNAETYESELQITSCAPLQRPQNLKNEFQGIQIVSFSSLAKENSLIFEEAKKTENLLLPAGAKTGEILHLILEKIDLEKVFQATHPTQIEGLIKKFIEETEFSEKEKILATLVFNAFHTPLTLRSGSFALKEIFPQNCFREFAFFYQEEPSNRFVKGVVDFFFEHEGSYYFIDWKSNDLPCYTFEALEEEMKKHHYLLQASLYKTALDKFLAQSNSTWKVESAFYLFLRDLPNGIYPVFFNE